MAVAAVAGNAASGYNSLTEAPRCREHLRSFGLACRASTATKSRGLRRLVPAPRKLVPVRMQDIPDQIDGKSRCLAALCRHDFLYGLCWLFVVACFRMQAACRRLKISLAVSPPARPACMSHDIDTQGGSMIHAVTKMTKTLIVMTSTGTPRAINFPRTARSRTIPSSVVGPWQK